MHTTQAEAFRRCMAVEPNPVALLQAKLGHEAKLLA
jgi:hypothetical protein